MDLKHQLQSINAPERREMSPRRAGDGRREVREAMGKWAEHEEETLRECEELSKMNDAMAAAMAEIKRSQLERGGVDQRACAENELQHYTRCNRLLEEEVDLLLKQEVMKDEAIFHLRDKVSALTKEKADVDHQINALEREHYRLSSRLDELDRTGGATSPLPPFDVDELRQKHKTASALVAEWEQKVAELRRVPMVRARAFDPMCSGDLPDRLRYISKVKSDVVGRVPVSQYHRLQQVAEAYRAMLVEVPTSPPRKHAWEGLTSPPPDHVDELAVTGSPRFRTGQQRTVSPAQPRYPDTRQTRDVSPQRCEVSPPLLPLPKTSPRREVMPPPSGAVRQQQERQRSLLNRTEKLLQASRMYSPPPPPEHGDAASSHPTIRSAVPAAAAAERTAPRGLPSESSTRDLPGNWLSNSATSCDVSRGKPKLFFTNEDGAAPPASRWESAPHDPVDATARPSRRVTEGHAAAPDAFGWSILRDRVAPPLAEGRIATAPMLSEAVPSRQPQLEAVASEKDIHEEDDDDDAQSEELVEPSVASVPTRRPAAARADSPDPDGRGPPSSALPSSAVHPPLPSRATASNDSRPPLKAALSAGPGKEGQPASHPAAGVRVVTPSEKDASCVLAKAWAGDRPSEAAPGGAEEKKLDGDEGLMESSHPPVKYQYPSFSLGDALKGRLKGAPAHSSMGSGVGVGPPQPADPPLSDTCTAEPSPPEATPAAARRQAQHPPLSLSAGPTIPKPDVSFAPTAAVSPRRAAPASLAGAYARPVASGPPRPAITPPRPRAGGRSGLHPPVPPLPPPAPAQPLPPTGSAFPAMPPAAPPTTTWGASGVPHASVPFAETPHAAMGATYSTLPGIASSSGFSAGNRGVFAQHQPPSQGLHLPLSPASPTGAASNGPLASELPKSVQAAMHSERVERMLRSGTALRTPASPTAEVEPTPAAPAASTISQRVGTPPNTPWVDGNAMHAKQQPLLPLQQQVAAAVEATAPAPAEADTGTKSSFQPFVSNSEEEGSSGGRAGAPRLADFSAEHIGGLAEVLADAQAEGSAQPLSEMALTMPRSASPGKESGVRLKESDLAEVALVQFENLTVTFQRQPPANRQFCARLDLRGRRFTLYSKTNAKAPHLSIPFDDVAAVDHPPPGLRLHVQYADGSAAIEGTSRDKLATLVHFLAPCEASSGAATLPLERLRFCTIVQLDDVKCLGTSVFPLPTSCRVRIEPNFLILTGNGNEAALRWASIQRVECTKPSLKVLAAEGSVALVPQSRGQFGVLAMALSLYTEVQHRS